MKIKLNQLRRIIREEVASNANVPQKLYHAEVSARASEQDMDLAGYLEMLADRIDQIGPFRRRPFVQ